MNNDYLANRIKNICSEEYKYFFKKENVVGVAYGYKVKNAFRVPKECIAVFVQKKLSKNKINKRDLIPETYKGIDTDVIESGVFKNNSLTDRIRPALGGYIIGPETQIGGGTYGCIVTEGTYYYILTSAHVINPFYDPKIGISVLQPCKFYSQDPTKDVIGIVSKMVPVQLVTAASVPVNYVDCSISKVVKRSQISTKIAFLGRLKGTNKNPIIDLEVQKVGAISELTQGKIIYLYGNFISDLGQGKQAFFKDQIMTTSMQSKGDSGAVLVDKNIKVVGLCQGTNKQKTMDFVNPIDTVLSSLNVSIVTG